MKIAFTHNLKLTDCRRRSGVRHRRDRRRHRRRARRGGPRGREDRGVGPGVAPGGAPRGVRARPHLQHRRGPRGRAREAFYPALFEELGYPVHRLGRVRRSPSRSTSGSPSACSREHGIDTPRGRLVTPRDLPRSRSTARSALPLPGHRQAQLRGLVEGHRRRLGGARLDARCAPLVEQHARAVSRPACSSRSSSPGIDVTVPLRRGRSATRACSTPVEYVIDPSARARKYNIYDYRLKNVDAEQGQRALPGGAAARRAGAPAGALEARSCARSACATSAASTSASATDGRIYFLEVNALPSLEPGAALFAAAQARGARPTTQPSAQIVEVGRRCAGSSAPPDGAARKRAAAEQAARRLHLQHEARRLEGAATTPRPSTTRPRPSRPSATPSSRYGHEVVPLEANADCRSVLAEAASTSSSTSPRACAGATARRRCRRCASCSASPYTGSDSATLALALDKALTKQILRQHGILTPEFQVIATGREKLHPTLR